VREKYCWLVADKPSEQGASLEPLFATTATMVEISSTVANGVSDVARKSSLNRCWQQR
jgi:hypothetical protein